ncbi:MAG TPA: class I SAM-dependent methyltransferase [Rhodopila sp.]|uniref:class I SAM-dependent methyltransferase n=1 Tax=Rhodopila sp. TaxID=2480087 RepID=UPI002C50E622|nr:class I SAM-dependent methyltransferase [Rhodopila sp.]HVY14149.1 class I SAM-dependent methyltransferase [Rhodopila sp.]
MTRSVDVRQAATPDNFDGAAYLAANPDVARAVAAGQFSSGRDHFDRFGHRERRFIRVTAPMQPLREAKMVRLRPALRLDLPHVRRGGMYDFLTEDLRQEGAVSDDVPGSRNAYPPIAEEIIAQYGTGLILDLGAGQRDVYFENVVNFEIIDYDTTDVRGIGEKLPFKDDVFDAVISIAVLEHLRDPFACAREMVRVLKPGGRLLCNVPFLQPLHGYPHHYYNMTHQGLRALFEPALRVDEVIVPPEGRPIWTLRWMLDSWFRGLPEPARTEFLSMTVQDLLQPIEPMLRRSWVTNLPEGRNLELASLTSLRAHKPR